MQTLNFHTDFCICESGKLIKDCCLTETVSTVPPPPKTGFSHPRCYAHALNDCSNKLSREHYLNAILLNSGYEPIITIAGVPWLENREARTISANDLASKVLCERHNNALGGLDALAIKFFRFLGKDHTEEALLINGHEIERWLLKLLCGAFASGNFVLNSTQTDNWSPSEQWLQILFGSRLIPPGAGLHYIMVEIPNIKRNENRLSPFENSSTNTPIGFWFIIGGFTFLFAMEPYPSEHERLRYRPMALQIIENGKERVVHLGWKKGKFITIEIDQINQ